MDIKLDVNNLTNRQIREANDFVNFHSYKQTGHSSAFFNADYKIIFVDKGNQAGGTALIGFNYVVRILGWHPVPKKNMLYFECKTAILKEKAAMEKSPGAKDMPGGHFFSPLKYFNELQDKPCSDCGEEIFRHERRFKVLRFASQSLPVQTEKTSERGDMVAEVKNTQYPEFTYWLPPFLLKKDVTSRSQSQIIRDPYGGNDIIVEYVSYNQTAKRVAGHKRTFTWLDELAPETFYDEQFPRLLLEDGDICISYTPTEDGIGYYYDRVFERAKVFYRSQTMLDYYKREQNLDYKQIEFTDSKESIAVIQMATDDNPLLTKERVDNMYVGYDDPVLVDMRRYGQFAAVSGRIYKAFDMRTHFINYNKYFGVDSVNPRGIPDGWTFFRSEDWHDSVNLAIIFVALSPFNEAFVWAELNPSPEHNTTLAVCEMIAEVSGEERKFGMNLIDPLAGKNQSNTGRSVIDDMNGYFKEMKKQGVCTGGWWESANTKSVAAKADNNVRGREKIRERLYNSSLCEKPFNNRVVRDRLEKRLPTLWILDDCSLMAKSLQKWRLEKGKPTIKWSHFCTSLEFLMKDVRFSPRKQHVFKPKKVLHRKYFVTNR